MAADISIVVYKLAKAPLVLLLEGLEAIFRD